MGGEGARETKLHDAASQGDVTAFQQLLQEDPYVLDRVSYACSNRSPLHTATLLGNLEIVEEVLRRNPQLARELDSQMSSPLHIAAAQGYVEIASLLLSAAPSVCWSRDCHGMSPVHIAAMNGHVQILEELIQMDPFPARETVDRGYTALHLCVKHRQLKALEVLVQNVGELVDEKDGDGNTVLHLAARYKQHEMMLYLVKNSKIDKQSRNSKSLTALQILEEYRLDSELLKIRKILRKDSGIRKAPIMEAVKKAKELVMVTVILIITMAFQAVVSPPGGVWQEDSSTHRAGEAVMASNRPKIFKHFVRANTVAFVTSFITIVLLTTGLYSLHSIFTVAVLYTMWMSLASIAVSYGASIMVITPNTETQSLTLVITTVVVASVIVIGVTHIRGHRVALKRRKRYLASQQDP